MGWKKGDRFSYIRMIGGIAYGTVLGVKGTIVTAHLDCQKEDEVYYFHINDNRMQKDGG